MKYSEEKYIKLSIDTIINNEYTAFSQNFFFIIFFIFHMIFIKITLFIFKKDLHKMFFFCKSPEFSFSLITRLLLFSKENN